MYKLPVFLPDSQSAVGEAVLHEEEPAITLSFGPGVTHDQVASWLMGGQASVQVNPTSSLDTEYDFGGDL